MSVAGLPAGSYDWRAKGPQYLANSGSVLLAGAPQTVAEMGLMPAGDCDNDNVVNVTDFNVVKSTFGMSLGDPGHDDRADFNGDTAVNILDFTLLRNNFALSGAPPIGPQ